MSSDRRQFLQRLTLSGVALGALPGTLSAAEPTISPDFSEAPQGLTAFQEHVAMEASALQPAAAPTFDVSWTQKMTGKYRAVFDSPSIAGGAAVWRAGMWVNHYKDLMKVPVSELNPVIVLRHAGIPLVMNHEFWDTYDLAKKNNVRDPMTDKKTRRNPVLMTQEEDKLPASFASYNLQKQIERGVVVLACNLAFGQMVSMVAKKEKLNMGEARTKAISMMVPGIILQPNGIFGVTLAQHNGCAFVQAT